MLLFENISLALSGLWANKMRALLTMLGIIIGIGSVIGIMTVGSSMQNSVTSSMQSMGAGNITVSLTQKSDSDAAQGDWVRMFRPDSYSDEDLFTDAMLEDFRAAYGDDLYALALSETLGQYTIKNAAGSVKVNATGVNNDYQQANDVQITRGRFFTEEDQEKGRQVAVVSDVLCQKLFPGQEPIGQSFQVTVGSKVRTFYVVGVYTYENNGFIMESTDSTPTTDMYVPLSTAKAAGHKAAGYSSFTVVANTDVDTTAFLSQTENFFASYYTRNDSWTATASSLQSLLESMTQMVGTVSLAIAVIAGISLLVGGIGVMNIMLVSVTERTSEIGLKKAIGARKKSILVQFLTEAAVLTSIGGVLGVLAGLVLSQVVSQISKTPTAISISAIVGSVLFSMVIGLVFGLLPSVKAANLNPIDALRSE